MTPEAERDQLNAYLAEHGDPRSLRAEVAELREVLRTVVSHSLLEIRRAAFAPTIGVRYTEDIRAGIANECRRLEDFVNAALAGADRVSDAGIASTHETYE